MESIARLSFKQTFIKAQTKDAACSFNLNPQSYCPVKERASQALKIFKNCITSSIVWADSNQLDSKEAQLKLNAFFSKNVKANVVRWDVERWLLWLNKALEQ